MQRDHRKTAPPSTLAAPSARAPNGYSAAGFDLEMITGAAPIDGDFKRLPAADDGQGRSRQGFFIGIVKLGCQFTSDLDLQRTFGVIGQHRRQQVGTDIGDQIAETIRRDDAPEQTAVLATSGFPSPQAHHFGDVDCTPEFGRIPALDQVCRYRC